MKTLLKNTALNKLRALALIYALVFCAPYIRADALAIEGAGLFGAAAPGPGASMGSGAAAPGPGASTGSGSAHRQRRLSVYDPLEKGRIIPILMYHAVAEEPRSEIDELYVRPSELRAQLRYIVDNGFQTVTFEDLNNIGAFYKPVMLTFDDGYKDNYTLLYPMLKAYGLKATVFMISGATSSEEFMSPDELKEVSDSGYISIQSHSASHVTLTDISTGSLVNELLTSKSDLGAIVKKPIIALSYPFGAMDKTVASAASQYYKYAVLSDNGKFICGGNTMAMKRIEIARGISMKRFAALIN